MAVRDVGRLCSSVVRAVDRQSKDLGSNPSAVESVIFSTERFSNSLNIESCNLLKSYKNAYRKSSAKRECHDENVFLKADRALSKSNFLFYLN